MSFGRLSGRIRIQRSIMNTPSAPSLACRLLAAANAAYYIDASGSFTAPSGDNIYNSVLWNGTPQAIVGAPLKNEDIDACLVGSTTDGYTVVSFRGTLLLSTLRRPKKSWIGCRTSC
jgi:hypothetical protein